MLAKQLKTWWLIHSSLTICTYIQLERAFGRPPPTLLFHLLQEMAQALGKELTPEACAERYAETWIQFHSSEK